MLLPLIVSSLAVADLSAQHLHPIELPARFSAHRIHVCPVTQGGDTLCFYTDTGGGTNMLYQPTAERLDLPDEQIVWGDQTSTVTRWPDWRDDASIPVAGDTTTPLGSNLMIVPLSGQVRMIHSEGDAGFLGRLWFADRVWTIDYPAKQLSMYPGDELPPSARGRAVPLGFQTDSSGRRTTHFPRITVEVDGDSLDLLFDTGATMSLTDSALSMLDDAQPARRASSFISSAVFERWRAAHPDWRVIEQATSFGAALIRVPEVGIAGHTVGPVWFEQRPEGTFENAMSQMMDRQIVGALGGNAMRFFRVTVDYPGARALFEQP